MKKLIFLLLWLIPTLAFAITSEFVLNTVTVVTGTKTGTLTVSYTTPVFIETASTGVSMAVNGTGTTFPIIANTQYKFQPGGSVTSLVFSQSSSASPFSVKVVK